MLCRTLNTLKPLAYGAQHKYALMFRTMSTGARNVAGKMWFTKDHEYIKVESEKTAFIGISDFAQNSLGEIVFVDLPNKVRLVFKKFQNHHNGSARVL